MSRVGRINAVGALRSSAPLSLGTERSARVLIVVIAISLFFVLAGTASAYTYDRRSGSPGNVVTTYKVQGSHYDACGINFGYQCWVLWLHSGGPLVSRSPQTKAAQRVSVEYQLYRWENSRWAYKTRQVKQGTIRRGYSRTRLPGLNVLPSHPYGIWSAYIFFRWYAANGKRLGVRGIDMNHARDYGCSTRFSNKCQVGRGWVWVGSPYT